MIKLFLFLITNIVSICAERYLDAPRLVKVVSVEPPGILVTWRSVAQNLSDPVVGYKIKIATIKSTTEEQFELVNGGQEPGYTVDIKPVDVFNINGTSDSDVKEVVIPGNDSGFLETIVKDLEYNELYEVRVLAYKADHDGPMSEPMRIKMVKIKDQRLTVIRQSTGCVVSVPAKLSDSMNEYTFYHESKF